MAIILDQRKAQVGLIAQEEILHINITDETIKIFDLIRQPIRTLVTRNGLEQWESEDYTISEDKITFHMDYEIGDKISVRYY